MKKWILAPLFLMAIVFSAPLTYGGVDSEVKSDIEQVAVTPAGVNLEQKEALKLDDGEYKGFVLADSSIPGAVQAGSVAMAFAGIALLFSRLWKSLASFKGQMALRSIALIGAVATGNIALGVIALFAPVALPWSGVLGDVSAEEALLTKIKDEVSKSVEKQVKDKGLTKEQIESVVSEKMKKYEDMDPVKLKNMIEDFEALKTEHSKIKNDLRKGNEDKMTLKGAIAEQFNDEQKWKDVQGVARRKAGSVELFTTKAVGNVTTGSVATDTSGNALLDLLNADDLRGLNLRDPFIEEYATVTRTSKAVIGYADYTPKEGAVNYVAEGAEKSQIDLKVEVKHATPKKAAGYIVQTDEAWQDIPRLESEARTLLLKKYLLRRQNGILFGDGQGENPLGVTEIAASYNPALAGVQNADADNLRDAIVAAAVQIYNTVNYADEVQYMPNVAFVNPSDFAGLKLIRTDHGYLFPDIQATANNGALAGFPVVAKSEIPVGKLLIGDFTYLNIVNYIDYTVSLGWVNDQFIKNMFTMIGEGRFFTYVRTLDQKAFIYDDIATILDGIKSGAGSGS